MSHEPGMANLALRVTMQHVTSAQPGAPVVSDRPARPLRRPVRRARATMASGLHRAAARLEPKPEASPAACAVS